MKLHGAKYFSKLDLSNAFYHLELSPESRDLTTFLSECGMFRFKRLMFGVNCAPEVFQREMTQILKDVENVIVYIDDILIFARSLEELRKTVATVLQILRKHNLTLNPSKCEFDKTHIRFIGHELDEHGFHVDREKVKSIERKRQDDSVYRRFAKCVGAVLVQEDSDGNSRIISFASKALTSTEKRYAQNQREALGAVWGVEHFSYFLLGRHFLLRTDAQGVSFILNRSRENSKRALTRADGWALRLSPYSYDVEYIRGRDNIADPSSRLYIANDEPFDETFTPWEIASIESNCFEFLTQAEVQEATANDEDLQQVIVALKTGSWPKSLRKYELVAEDLSVSNGVLIKRGCAVIPRSLQKKALNVAHSGHPMAAKMKSILRERVWWPGITIDTEEWVGACQACATTGRPEKPTPMKRSFAPKTAWDTIAIDFNGPYAKLGGILILVVVDYRSRYLIARPIKCTSFEHTKRVLENIFKREGYPQNIKSDNGPPFNSEDYKTYCRERGINVIFTTPLFPQQNGLVEGYMKLVNKAMATALSTGTNYREELQAAVDAHNAAAHTVTRIPPEEIMMGRKIRRRLPLLVRGDSDHDNGLVDIRDRQAKLRAKQYEDARRGARESRVKSGDVVITERTVRTKGDTRFDPTKFTVVEENNGNLVLCDSDGRTLRRHITQTRKVNEWRDCKTDAVSDNDGGETTRRSSNRDRKPPAYLDSYIRVCQQEDSDRHSSK
ncbi:uncharacterized protein K02A2.6-like [Topomyia yanbarensis]|uniref:uncharacterized protein K02A2.6-like n=1 Tax=Topomyia yanbarensis TaxID=2498891 RepID=UPI00273C4CEB|nr:uncharacterized protein K02A2.6-like [Topomyia yanbarensis]